jgi:hypothetical protein
MLDDPEIAAHLAPVYHYDRNTEATRRSIPQCGFPDPCRGNGRRSRKFQISTPKIPAFGPGSVAN